jgi:hypothetical protein
MSTTGSNRRGFRPSRNQGGNSHLTSKRYKVDGNNAIIMIGDAVTLTSGKAAIYATAQAANYLGIVRACYDANGKPFTHVQPGRGPYMPASTGGYVDVWDDPDMRLLVEIDEEVSGANVGFLAEVNVTAGVTATGISRQHLCQITAASGNTPFRIVGLSPEEIDGAGGSGNNAEVVAVFHVYRKQA